MDETHLSDPASERAVLAGVCAFGGDAYLDVADLLTTESFTVDSNQYLWASLGRILADDPKAAVDLPSIMAAARALGFGEQFDKPEEKQHLRAVMNFPVERGSVRKLAGVVKKLEVARGGYRHLKLAQENLLSVTGSESVDHIIGLAEQPIVDWTTALAHANSEGPKPIGEGLREYANHLANHQRDVVGLSSGFRKYDEVIGGGFRPGTVNVIGARVKVGKSLVATNVAVRLSSGSGYTDHFRDGGVKPSPAEPVPVLQLDTEMSIQEQWARQLALVSGVTIDDIEKGKYANDTVKAAKVAKAIDRMEKWPYDFLSIAGQPFEETVATMRRWVTKRVGLNEDGSAKPCLIIFDYLKLMDSESMNSKNLAEFQVLGFMMTGLHNFASKYKVPLLTFIQLNRDGINTEDTSVASGSDRIMWLCSNFTIYKAKTEEEVAEQTGADVQYNRKLVPICARHGKGLDYGDYINFMSRGEVATLAEGPTRNELAKGVTPSGNRSRGIIVDDTTDQEPAPFAL